MVNQKASGKSGKSKKMLPLLIILVIYLVVGYFMGWLSGTDLSHGAKLHSVHEAHSLFSIGSYEVPAVVTTMWGIMILMAIVFFLMTRKMAIKPVKSSQVALEMIIGAVYGLVEQTMGNAKNTKKYFPFICSLFLVIIVSNYSGMIPGSSLISGFQAPTTALNTTVGLALVVFFATHIIGIATKGPRYFKHFLEPFPGMLPLNIMDELVKPLSLSLRLYGSIFADEVILVAMFNLIPAILPIPFYFLGLFFGFLQALVFTLLTTTYISSSTALH